MNPIQRLFMIPGDKGLCQVLELFAGRPQSTHLPIQCPAIRNIKCDLYQPSPGHPSSPGKKINLVTLAGVQILDFIPLTSQMQKNQVFQKETSSRIR